MIVEYRIISLCNVNNSQVASATHDRQHADKMLNEYVTTTITTVVSAFFGSQFSEQSTAVKVTATPVYPVYYYSVQLAFTHCLNKCLANAKRPCDCRVLCLRLKSSLCSCAHSISDMTSFGCHDQGRDSVCPVL